MNSKRDGQNVVNELESIEDRLAEFYASGHSWDENIREQEKIIAKLASLSPELEDLLATAIDLNDLIELWLATNEALSNPTAENNTDIIKATKRIRESQKDIDGILLEAIL